MKEELENRINEIEGDEYFFFWDGPFSNWHPSPFEIDGITFNCGEQFMMYEKAMTFNDLEMAHKILNTPYPRDQKALGRKVRGYDNEVWSKVRYNVVKRGLVEKFRQNDDLREFLFSKRDKIIVEASPYDRIWGIGYGEFDPQLLEEKEHWGENLLGKLCNEIADELWDEYNN